jgi:3-methyladenine DNA glycosylase AlkD
LNTQRTALAAKTAIQKLASPARARVSKSFFKAAPGQYGEGDQFLGVDMPSLRRLAREFRGMAHGEVLKLIRSPWHEVRMLGLLLWMEEFDQAHPSRRRQIHLAYLRYTRFINNWDLVDVSAPWITGAWSIENPSGLAQLRKRLRSPLLWDRRIAMVSTLAWIRVGKFEVVTEFAAQLLADREDLMHKATGWMLREMGKRDRARLTAFLSKYARQMPRTMLRYAIEHYTKSERAAWLAGDLK